MEGRGVQDTASVSDSSLNDRITKLEERMKQRATKTRVGRLEERIDGRATTANVWMIAFTVAGGMATVLLIATRFLPFLQIPGSPAG